VIIFNFGTQNCVQLKKKCLYIQARKSKFTSPVQRYRYFSTINYYSQQYLKRNLTCTVRTIITLFYNEKTILNTIKNTQKNVLMGVLSRVQGLVGCLNLRSYMRLASTTSSDRDRRAVPLFDAAGKPYLMSDRNSIPDLQMVPKENLNYHK